MECPRTAPSVPRSINASISVQFLSFCTTKSLKERPAGVAGPCLRSSQAGLGARMARRCAGCGEPCGWHDCAVCKEPVHTSLVCDMVVSSGGDGVYSCSSCSTNAVRANEQAESGLMNSPSDSHEGAPSSLECAGCGERGADTHRCSVCAVACHSAEECAQVRLAADGSYKCEPCAVRLPQGVGPASTPRVTDTEPELPRGHLDVLPAPAAAASNISHEHFGVNSHPRNLSATIQAASATTAATVVAPGLDTLLQPMPQPGDRLKAGEKWGYVFDSCDGTTVHLVWDAHDDVAASYQKHRYTGMEGWQTFTCRDEPEDSKTHGGAVRDVLRASRGAKLPSAYLCGPSVKSRTWSLFHNYVPAVSVPGADPVADDVGLRTPFKAGEMVGYSSNAVFTLKNETEHDIPNIGEAHLMAFVLGASSNHQYSRRYALLSIEEHSPAIVLFLVKMMEVSATDKPESTLAALQPGEMLH